MNPVKIMAVVLAALTLAGCVVQEPCCGYGQAYYYHWHYHYWR